MVDSKSTDKLALLTQTAQRALAADPAILDKIQSISVTWSEVGDVAVPDVRIVFNAPVPPVGR
jgi:hypothetical protein